MIKVDKYLLQNAVLLNMEDKNKLSLFLKTRHDYELITIEERIDTGETIDQLLKKYSRSTIQCSLNMGGYDIDYYFDSPDSTVKCSARISMQAMLGNNLRYEDTTIPCLIKDLISDSFMKLSDSIKNSQVLDTELVAEYISKNTVLEGETFIRFMYLGDIMSGGLCRYYTNDDNLAFLAIDSDKQETPHHREIQSSECDDILFIPSSKITFSLEEFIDLRDWSIIVAVDTDTCTADVIVDDND